MNALHVASYAGYNKTVRYLVQNKANVDITDIVNSQEQAVHCDL